MSSEATYKEAYFYENYGENAVRCFLCPHDCRIKPGKTGLCRVRKNIDGKLYSLNYGKVTSLALDPIEKKPLKLFHPGSYIVSAGTFGCNFKCSYCQNWQISQAEPEAQTISAEQMVNIADSARTRGNIGIAYTYNEPFIWYEYIYDCCRAAKEKNLYNVLVTNGFVRKQPLEKIISYIDAMNIDVKAFTEEFYKKYCKGSLEHVKRSVEYCADKCHIELTTLIIPGLNDSEEEIARLSEWIASIDSDIPLHLTRFFPNYNMIDTQPTPVEKLKSLHLVARQALNNVFIGNV
jgi:pyruvate formate lyase activating enzyme